jgi:hypothetical protein
VSPLLSLVNVNEIFTSVLDLVDGIMIALLRVVCNGRDYDLNIMY